MAIAALAALPLTTMAQLPMPQEQTVDQLTFVNGGVTTDEAAFVRRIATHYPLRVVLAERDGSYSVADHVTVLHDGKAMGTIDDAGPWLLIKLPPGHYTLEASFAGRTQRRDVDVATVGTTLQWLAPHS